MNDKTMTMDDINKLLQDKDETIKDFTEQIKAKDKWINELLEEIDKIKDIPGPGDYCHTCGCNEFLCGCNKRG